MTNDVVKPVYSLSMKGFGTPGLILFLSSMGISAIIYFQYGMDIMLWFVLQVMFILGGFTGRIFEGNYHKRVMSHMTPEYQNLYRRMVRCIADHDKTVGDIEIVKCDGCGVDTLVSKLDEHLCQRCLSEKEETETG